MRRRVFSYLSATCVVLCAVRASHAAPPEAAQGDRQQGAPAAAPPSSGIGMAAALPLDTQARRISFQALLTDDQGNPINNPNGQHELDFRFYNVANGGGSIGQILNVMVTLDGGIATTQVGPLDPDWFDGTARWLGVTVDNGVEMSPRTLLGSVPYAFRVDRVASPELDNDIDLGDSIRSPGSLNVFSGSTTPLTISLEGSAGRLSVLNPAGAGGFILHGQSQLMETRDPSGNLVGLFGYDSLGGGASCLLGTPDGSTGLLLDGYGTGGGGGSIVLYNNAEKDALSLSASSATLRVGSINGGAAAGNIHLYPTSGVSSRIHLDGQAADLRLGLTGVASGDLRLFSSFGGTESIYLNGTSGTITTSGSVGIGTTSPNHELVVQGDDPGVQIRDDTTDNSANAARLELLENSGGTFDGGAFFWWNGETNKLLIGTKLSGVNTNVLVVDRATGGVGIGTQTPGSHRLAVNGSIRAKEIVVDTGWSDFVFEPDYDLPSLEQIEDHIQSCGFLPDMPSAAEVAANGIKLGEMDSKLLQKIEELTLHMIEMNKRVQFLEQENARLRKEAQ